MVMVDWVVLELFEIVELFVVFEEFPEKQNRIHLFST